MGKLAPMVVSMVTAEFKDPGNVPPVVVTRLIPPVQQLRILRRQRVEMLLSAALEVPLTLVLAPPGAGETTALAGLAAHGGWPVAWCRLSSDDSPLVLLNHLVAAFRAVVALDDRALTTSGDMRDGVALLVNALATSLTDETLLILDDYHVADRLPELRAIVERLIELQPHRLHIVLSSRTMPELPAIATARVRGELIVIGRSDLAFLSSEARVLWELAQVQPPTDLDVIVANWRGWPIMLQLLTAQSSAEAQTLADAYLVREIFDPQSKATQYFLLASSVLRWLDPTACNALLHVEHGADLLTFVHERLVVTETDAEGRLHYLPFFHDLLTRLAHENLPERAEVHLAVAHHYQRHEVAEEAIYHLLAAGNAEVAAQTLVLAARGWLEAGEAQRVLSWLEQLPLEQAMTAELLEVRAAAMRQIGRFSISLDLFASAAERYAANSDHDGLVRALCGQAAVYLDTVQPAPATTLLKRAMKLIPLDQYARRAELLRLQAENWANRGRADVAMLLERAAARIEECAATPIQLANPYRKRSPAHLPPRLLLRSGRLHEARQMLETALGVNQTGDALLRPESDGITPSESLLMHREPLLLLSLIYALLGQGPRALAMAHRGLLEAQQSGSRLTEAIAEMRVGHACQVVASIDAEVSRQRYLQAEALIQQAGVERTRAEMELGRALLFGHGGDLMAANESVREGLRIAATAGDEWTAALLTLALGGAAVALGDERGMEWLEASWQRFLRGGDTYGQAVVILWRALRYLRMGNEEATRRALETLLHLVRSYGYEGLLTAPTLFGPRDLAMLIPLLLRSRALPAYATYAQQLLRQGFPSIAADEGVEEYHPGYTLRVQMLGTFRVWRGWSEIHAREWQREKARQLFQLLLTYRGHWIQREQICSFLWPESDPEAAERQFKVTLNALNAALEPQRPPRISPFFIRRQGLAYSFSPSYGCWIDVDEFELRATSAHNRTEPGFALRNSQIAVQLYRGDFLAEALYDPWTLEERERLLARFLGTSTAYAVTLMELGEHDHAIQLCEQVLRRDRCYEEAYQVLMRTHARSGSRSQALRAFTRYQQALTEDLGIEPLPETIMLVERIKRNEPV